VLRANRPAIQPAEYITPQDIAWIWQPYIPRGMLVMLDGDPGIGKSMTLVQIAANLSRSWAFLDQLGKPTLTPDIDGPASTLMLSAEDSLEHVMVPRLTQAGADLTLSHSIGFSGRQMGSYVEGSSTRDFPLIHDAWSQDYL
jgi:AAA domain-containing protein